jgi:uncharacterized protein with PIN domain
MKLLCDEMLQGLGRWLRAAGYDTAIARRGLDDRDIVSIARSERRMLLTCDRELGGRLELEGRVVALPPSGLDAAALAVRDRLQIDWLRAPFTRCLLDNTPLRPAAPGDLSKLPLPARDGPGPIRTCPACSRIYWPGSHVRRMRARLERWQAA